MALTLRDAEIFAAGLLAGIFVFQAVRFVALRRLVTRMRAEGRTHGYNFTDRVRMSLAAARKAASELAHDSVDTGDILLGVLRTEPGVAVAILQNLHVDLDQLRANVQALGTQGSLPKPGADLPYTARAKRALEESMAAAREMNHNYVGTEHVLLGLIRENGVAAKALAKAGVTLENASAGIPGKPNDAA